MISLTISKNDANQTLINFIKKMFKETKLSIIYKLFRTKNIKVNGKAITDFKYQLQENDVVMIYDNNLKLSTKIEPLKVQIPPDIFYEDENLLIVFKPHNLIVHHPYNNSLDTIVRYYLQEQNLKQEGSFVISHQYRLDKLTAGLIIYPKNKLSQQALVQAMEQQQIIKKYYAVCEGLITKPITLSGYIRHDELQKKMIFQMEEAINAKNCTTIFTPIFSQNNFSLIECQLVTGRKHQIRSSLQFLNLPIIGDTKYGSKIAIPEKIALFAYYLKFKVLPEPLSYLNNEEFFIKDLKANLIKNIRTEKW